MKPLTESLLGDKREKEDTSEFELSNLFWTNSLNLSGDFVIISLDSSKVSSAG